MTANSDDATAFSPAPIAPPQRGGVGLKLQIAIFLLAFAAGLAAMAWFYSESRREPGSAVAQGGDGPGAVALDPAAAVATQATGAPPAPRVALPPLAPDVATARVAELETRLARLSVEAQTASGYANRAEAMMTAFAARRALESGADLSYLEPRLRVIFGEGQPKAVATIINAARQPVTVPMLRRGLEGLRAAALKGDPRASWWDGLVHGIGNLAVVRSADTPPPEPERRLDEARVAVEAGQIDEAIRQISALPARPEMAQWLEQARRFNEARRALDVIEAAAIIEPRVAAAVAPAAAPAVAAAR